jgi:hypothetical protein
MDYFATSRFSSDRGTEPPNGRRLERLVTFGRAIGHPARARILLAYADAADDVRRPVALARELELPLGVVSYHVRTLAGLGLLVLRATTTVRGAVAHDYAVADDLAPALRSQARAVGD